MDQINLTYNPQYNYDQAIDFSVALEKKLKERFTVAKNDQRAIRVFNMAMQNKGINQMTSVLGILILIIGMGTLIAGIVGISNIMIFIVKERTKEIGVRKALGATSSSIVGQIVQESVVLMLVSGCMGLVIGVWTLQSLAPYAEHEFFSNPKVDFSSALLALGILVGVGVISALGPATRAVSIRPVEALRDE